MQCSGNGKEGSRLMHVLDVLTLSETSPDFYVYMQYKFFENTVGKKETARHEQFLLIPQCVLPV